MGHPAVGEGHLRRTVPQVVRVGEDLALGEDSPAPAAVTADGHRGRPGRGHHRSGGVAQLLQCARACHVHPPSHLQGASYLPRLVPATGETSHTGVVDTPLARALDRVGDRWTLLVVDGLLEGPRRFGELQESLDRIAPNILTSRLRELERQGLVVATPYSRRPLRMAYELTEGGRELAGALEQLAAWGAHHEGLPAPRHHRACGSALELRGWCPTCERVVEGSEEDEVTWA
ncbi:MAG: hypothetical protein GEV08_22590 [Acidimicrobiia bacterium]|nr:hypothetical protein [Acidimicrobiia bacterium]